MQSSMMKAAKFWPCQNMLCALGHRKAYPVVDRPYTQMCRAWPIEYGCQKQLSQDFQVSHLHLILGIKPFRCHMKVVPRLAGFSFSLDFGHKSFRCHVKVVPRLAGFSLALDSGHTIFQVSWVCAEVRLILIFLWIWLCFPSESMSNECFIVDCRALCTCLHAAPRTTLGTLTGIHTCPWYDWEGFLLGLVFYQNLRADS